MGTLQSRKRYEPNEIVLFNDYAEIIIYNKNKTEKCRTTIDLEDINKINNTVWSLGSGGYVRTHYKNNNINTCIHRVIMNVTSNSNILIDHIDMNKLNNRKNNLRVANKSNNGMNKETQSNNTLGFRGVSIDKRRNKFRSYIKINGIQTSLGYYTTFMEAKQARLNGEIKYFGEFQNKTELNNNLLN